MKWTCSVLTVATLSLLGGSLMSAQDLPASIPANLPAKNPLEGNEAAIKYGMGLYRSRCADCHGMDARGVRAPDLTQVWASGRTDDGLFKTLKAGVPGTEMPAVGPRTPDDEVWKILAYVRTLAAPAPTDPPRGDAQKGQQV